MICTRYRPVGSSGSTQIRSSGTSSVSVPPACRLVRAAGGLVAALAGHAVAHAAVQIVAAEIARMAYLTGAEDPTGQRVATYGPPTWLTGPVTLLGANGILGPGPDGDTLLHCHAVVVDAAGRLHGGHLPPGDVLLGQGGAIAVVTPLREAAFAAVYDSETNYPLFQPTRIGP